MTRQKYEDSHMLRLVLPAAILIGATLALALYPPSVELSFTRIPALVTMPSR